MVKKCSKCKQYKNISNFSKNKTMKDGLQYECKSCRKIMAKKYWRKCHLKRHYNITTEEYNKMFGKQQECCAICGKHQSKLSTTLGVDHDHITGKVRGLLCRACNTILGVFEKNFNRCTNYLMLYSGEL